MAEGRITREGIRCNCCQKIFGLRNAHAGNSRNRPSANIYFEDGSSLLECQMEMKSKQSVENKEGSRFTSNDYICSVCHYGGDLVLCDGCPSSFHADCLGIKELPDGDWFCPSCCCKVCGESRFVENRNQFTDNTGLMCCQCNHKYHVRCMIGKGPGKLDNFPEGNWFCNKRCELIFLGMHHLLEKLVIVDNDNLTWTLLKYKESDDDESSAEIYCRLCVALNVVKCLTASLKERTKGPKHWHCLHCTCKGKQVQLKKRTLPGILNRPTLRKPSNKLMGNTFWDRAHDLLQYILESYTKNLPSIFSNNIESFAMTSCFAHHTKK